MAGSRISNTVTHTVDLGSHHYPSPLTITRTGDVAPAAYGANAVYAATGLTNLTLVNHGTITAAGGSFRQTGNAGDGGIGVDLRSPASVDNTGHITGGAGGGSLHYDGQGGIGLYQVAGTLTNKGAITGGAGGNGSHGGGYAPGGIGVLFGGTGVLTNGGVITGGVGGGVDNAPGAAGYGVGAGGAGVALLEAGTLTNTGTIQGGYGGSIEGGTSVGGVGVMFEGGGRLDNRGVIAGGGGGSYGGSEGAGVAIDGGGTLSNAGTILGGNGTYRHDGGSNGAVGISLGAEGTLINSGIILAGAGGDGLVGGSGGIGVDGLSGDAVVNTGMIFGGNGGDGESFASQGGAGVVLNDATFVTSGTIAGGAAGRGGGFSQGGAGVVLNGGTLVMSGTILGGAGGHVGYVGGQGGAGVVLNDATLVTSGTITGGAAYGYSYGGHYADQGGAGVVLDRGTLVTSGTITGGAGGGGRLTQGGAGVVLNGGALVTSGTITGGASSGTYPQADAVQFGSLAGTLVVDPGAVFSGNVVAVASLDDVLTLGGSGAGTLGGLGAVSTHFTPAFANFTKVTESAGAKWTLTQANVLGATTNLLDAGSLDVAGNLTDAGAATVSDKAELQAIGNGTILLSGDVTLSGGTFATASHGVLAIGTSLVGAEAGQITVDAGASLTGDGRFLAPVVDSGSIVAQSGTLNLADSASGTGVLTIGSGAAVWAHASLSIASIVFAAGGNEFLLGRASELTSIISGFGSGDVIDIRPLVATTLSFLAGTLTLLDGGKVVDQLFLSGNYDNADFALSSDHHGGTDISFVTGADESITRAWDFHAADPFLSWLPHGT